MDEKNQKDKVELGWGPKNVVKHSTENKEDEPNPAPEKAVKKKATYFISEETIELIQRASYWERETQGDIIESLVKKLQEEKGFNPIPKK